jgi:uncharacterized repeat protein (TIGR03806 family)
LGVVNILIGVGYFLAARNLRRSRGFLTLAFAFQAVLELWLTFIAANQRLKVNLPVFVLAVALCYLLPLAVIIFAIVGEQRSKAGVRLTDKKSSSHWVRKGAVWAAWAAMLVAILLPPSWALAHAVTSVSARLSMMRRPAKWTPIKANLPKSPGEEFDFAAVDCWPDIQVQDPTFVTEVPDGSGRMVVLERVGRIRVFSKNTARGDKPAVFLDIVNRTMHVPNKAEDGLLGLAFHPEYANASSPHHGEFFVRYTSDEGGKRTNRLSRFVANSDGTRVDEKSETVLIEMPEETAIHKGGALQFGSDKFLYATFGTDARHFPHAHSQHIDYGLWAGVLRLDVDCRGGDVSHAPLRQPSVGRTASYYIPNDNPFVGRENALEEFYSIGLRNPWRMTIDTETNRVFVGDVGDRRREEIDICTPGSNHQYDYLEGTLPVSTYTNDPPKKPEHFIGVESPPVFEYPHDGTNRCVIGGYVYRGKKLPELVGKYVYGDQVGRIYALTLDDQNKAVNNELIATVRGSGLGISSFGVDADGELYVCWIRDLATPNSKVFRLEHAEHAPEQQFPERLSQTGLFRDLTTLEPNASLIPFEVNTPLWSDRAVKHRWIGLPSEEKISGDAGGRWKFPMSTIAVKHFDLPLDERTLATDDGPPKTRRLETRVLVTDDKGGVFGASYRWNDDNSEAYLVTRSATEEIDYTDKDGNAKKQTWMYPGRLDCLSCHNSASTGILGFNARQLNRDVHTSGLSENQLLKFAAAGMFAFDRSDAELAKLPKLTPISDKTAGVEQRVKSYLDANCSHCHQPGGRAAMWDARFETPLAQAQIIDGTAFTHRGDDKRARVVKPADLNLSFMFIRMSSDEPALRMPPLGRNVMHNDAVALVKEWIQSMPRAEKAAKHDSEPKQTVPSTAEDADPGDDIR